MRTPLASALVLSVSALVAACSVAPEDAERTGTSHEALRRLGSLDDAPPVVIADPPPPPPSTPKPPKVNVTNLGDLVAVDAPPAACTPITRFDLRRKTRACEDLPGAYAENGSTYVPGTGGRFRVGHLLGPNAPASLAARACSYTWLPDACAAPDKAKLLVEADEDLDQRPDCAASPAACAVATANVATKAPSKIPNGPGRCDVCGFASSSTMWVVLPPEWHGFSYQLAGDTTLHNVFLDRSVDSPAVVEVDLGAPVADQDVGLQLAIE